MAAMYKPDEGRTIVRLSDFSSSNGPKVAVVLADHAVMGNNVVDAISIDLGNLKGTSGNQNYVIPPGSDLHIIRAVSIYCERFHVNCGWAVLNTPRLMPVARGVIVEAANQLP